MRVVLVRRRGLGMGSEETEVSWPTAWRLPQAGETVSHPTAGGFVESLGWAPDEGIVRIYLR